MRQRKTDRMYHWINVTLFVTTLLLLLTISNVFAVFYAGAFFFITFVCPHLIVANQKYKQYASFVLCS